MKKRSISLAFLLLIQPICGSNWSIEDLSHLTHYSRVFLSPDNRHILAIFHQNDENDESLSQLRIYDLETQSWRTLIERVHEPRWSPDGERIAFIKNKQLFAMAVSGEEPVALTEEKIEVFAYAWSPDGKKIATIMDELSSDEEEDFFDLDEPLKTSHLWLIHLEDSSIEQLTDKRLMADVGSICWHPESSKIAFVTRSMDRVATDLSNAIYTIDLDTHQVSSLIQKKGVRATQPCYSPDGKWLAYCETEETYPHSSHAYVIPSLGGACQRLASTPNQDIHHTGGLIGWSKESTSLYVYDAEKTRTNIYALPLNSNRAQRLDIGISCLSEINLNFTHTAFCMVGESMEEPEEIYTMTLDDLQTIRHSSLNRSLSLQYPKTTLVHWQSYDGLEIEGLLTYPHNYEAGSRYPLIVVVHGGPMSHSPETFIGFSAEIEPIAALAAEGFAILRCNFRGSTGYGKEFRAANYRDFGGKDFDDIMSGIDALIREGIADENRIGISGWSYGGYMAAWAVSQSPRFKAAIMGAGMSDLVSMAGSIPHRSHYLPYYFGGEISDNIELYLQRSPLTKIHKISAPVLILHGMQDGIVPLSQGLEFYTALKRKNRQSVEMIVYPHMGHNFPPTSTLKDLQNRIVSWFKKHLRSDNVSQ